MINNEIDKIHITITEIINILNISNVLVPFEDCGMKNCKRYDLNSNIIKFNLKQQFTDEYIETIFIKEVYVCKHGNAHVCSELGCFYSKTKKENSIKYCSITNREQSVYSSFSVINLQLINGNKISVPINNNKSKSNDGFINKEYSRGVKNFDKQFNVKLEKFKKLNKKLLTNQFDDLNLTQKFLDKIVKKRYKKIGLNFLNFNKLEITTLLNIFLLKSPIYVYENCPIFFSSKRCFLNLSKSLNSDLKNSLNTLISFEILTVNDLIKRKKRTKNIFKKKESKLDKIEFETTIQLIKQMERVIFKALPTFSRIVSYFIKIREMHKLFFVKYLKHINNIKARIHTDLENKVIFQKFGSRPTPFNFLKTFDFDNYWLFSKFEKLLTFQTHCKLLKRSLKLYFLRELCFRNSKKHNKKHKCIDPSEHTIAFLDLTKHGFEIKISGFSHVIIKRDIFVDKYLERLNKLTFIGFNSSSHNKGLKSLIFDLKYISKRFGPMAVFDFVNG